ncbi:MAG TPA: sodium:solute symporter family protein [Bryobacteraceae bacterium]|nr:sodium:solute symporter family protein [Bryobacteraceae bacterium]
MLDSPGVTLGAVDYLILAIYFALVLFIGWALKRKVATSADFLTSGRSVPLWITSLAFLAANLGAQEVIGMCASGAKYGFMTAHFYWVGAVPAMLFVGVFMMPFYYGSRARSVPEYLKLRFDEKTRALNAVTFAVMTVFSSGISMYALGLLFELVLHWSFTASVLLSAVIVLVYTFLGGLTSAIYNEVLQFFLIVLGFAPLAVMAVMKAGGWSGMAARMPAVMTHTWSYAGSASENPMGIEAFGLIAGLGFVLSFGYWCTDFLVVQRAMAAESMSGARRTPLIAAFPKMIMPFIVIVPGVAAVALSHMPLGYAIPHKAGGGLDYDQTLTTLMAQFYPSGMLGLGLTALMASFMSGMAGNVTAFNTVWTYDLYQGHIRKNEPDDHYLQVGRITTVVGVALSVAVAYLVTAFNNLNDFLQLVFSFVNAPLFATFLLGMFWKRATGHGAFTGLLAGTAAAAATHGLTVAEHKGGWLGAVLHTFPSTMAQNFWIAICAWSACFVVTILVSLASRPKPDSDLHNLVYGLTEIPHDKLARWFERPVPVAVVLIGVLLLLNWWFW